MNRFKYTISGFFFLSVSFFLPFIEGCNKKIEYPCDSLFEALVKADFLKILKDISTSVSLPFFIGFLFLALILVYVLTNRSRTVLIASVILLTLESLYFSLAFLVFLLGGQIVTQNGFELDNFLFFLSAFLALVLFLFQIAKRNQPPLQRLFATQAFFGLALLCWWLCGIPTMTANRLLYGYWVAVLASLLILLDGYRQFHSKEPWKNERQ